MSSPPRSPGEEQPIKKTRRKKKKPSPEQQQQSTAIPSLPEELLLSIFARISRLHYPCLSLVSKRFRSLLASLELYQTRSFLGRTETCLYVCLQFSPDPNPRWFTLCQKPSGMNKNKKSSCNILVPIPNLISPQAYCAGVVALGSSIYVIGGPINDSPSSDVWIFDCHCLAWRKAPSMRVKRTYPTANVFDGKIYVAGGCKDWNSSNWMEVFDPKTQTWEPVLSPLAERHSSRVCKSAVIQGTIFQMFGNERGVVYKPKEDRWDTVRRTSLDSGWTWFSSCVVDNVLYCFNCPLGLKWFSFKRRCWMSLNGLERLPKFAGHSCVKLADCGGKLAVLWTKNLRSSGNEEMMIWCAVIVLKKRNSNEIWGTVEQLDPVLKVPRSFSFVCVHAATA